MAPLRGVLWCLLVLAARAERLSAPAPGADGGRAALARAVRGPRRRLPLLLLAAVPAVSGEDTASFFASLDRDSNGLLTREEFTAVDKQQDMKQDLRMSTYFSQADVNDDGSLTLSEFQFSRYLMQDDYTQQRYREVAELLPQHFQREIDNMFERLARTSSGGVQLPEILAGLGRMLQMRDHEVWDSATMAVFNEMFARADIIRDGVLNLNELDYFHRLAREALIQASLEDASAAMGEEEMLQHMVGQYMEDFDQDGDGLLDEGEVASGILSLFREMEDAFGEEFASIAEGERLAAMARAGFAGADADSNGLLNPSEMAALLDLITLEADEP